MTTQVFVYEMWVCIPIPPSYVQPYQPFARYAINTFSSLPLIAVSLVGKLLKYILFTTKYETQWAVYALFAVAAFNDVIITGITCFYLRQVESPFSTYDSQLCIYGRIIHSDSSCRTRSKLSNIMQYVVASGLSTW